MIRTHRPRKFWSSQLLSIIIPFRAPVGSLRYDHFQWIRAYYEHHFPDAEIIIGSTMSPVFSKTQAVNSAVEKSNGRILAIVDADAYIDADVITECVVRADEYLNQGLRRWSVPYRRLYRLTQDITEAIVGTSPSNPLRLPSPPPVEYVESTTGSLHGRRYGAMMVIYPREAFDIVGGMDPRFEGWGGEDVAMARALDTMYGKHKTTDADIFHLWHPKIGESFQERKWPGQTTDEPNGNLAMRYSQATGDPKRMRALVDEGIAYGKENHTLAKQVQAQIKARLNRFKE